MANIAHSVLAGTEVHEPKGITSASLGQVYVADGNGSGNWAGVGTSSFTGMIADFVWPVVQDGWLELDGSDINIDTYGALYDVMTIQMTGTRVSGTNTITSLSSTSNMRVGYYVFGTGIASGTTITAVNSRTQITISNNASSSGTSEVVVSPWLLNTGTIRLPDVSTYGRFRRSRSSSTSVGQVQDDTFEAHTHTGTTSAAGSHSHTYAGATGGINTGHTHTYQTPVWTTNSTPGGNFSFYAWNGGYTTSSTAGQSNEHVHSYSGTTTTEPNHTHTMTTASTGSTETRPINIVLMTCVKT